jgi:hypothetical protein
MGLTWYALLLPSPFHSLPHVNAPSPVAYPRGLLPFDAGPRAFAFFFSFLHHVTYSPFPFLRECRHYTASMPDDVVEAMDGQGENCCIVSYEVRWLCVFAATDDV